MLKQPLYALITAIALGGCMAHTPAPAPDMEGPLLERPYVPSSLYSEFKTSDFDEGEYSAFLAATQAEQDDNHSLSADYYLKALQADPESRFIADRAFYQLLYGGEVPKAAALADQMVLEGVGAEDDLILLLATLKSFIEKDYLAALERTDRQNGSFSFLLSPITTAWSYAALGDVDAAKEALKPLNADVRLRSIAAEQLAYILDYKGMLSEAEVAYKALLKEPSAALQPIIAYTHMLYRMGKNKEARGVLTTQLQLQKNNTYLLREGARLARGLGPSEALASPNGALGMVFFRLSSEFSQSNTTQPAVLYGRIASYLMPQSADVYYLLGTVLEKGKAPESAAAAYNNVPIESGLRGLADVRRIEVLRRAGYSEVAEGLILKFLKERPDDVSMLVALGDIFQQREAYEQSILYYDKAIVAANKPRRIDWYMHFARAVSYERLGDWEEAEKGLQRALELSPDQPGVLNYLGYSWIDRGQNAEQAREMIEKAAAARPDDGFITDSLGWVYYLSGDYQKAVTVLEAAVKMEPNDVTINDHLGDAYWQVGRKIEARFQWRHAIDSGAEGDVLAQIQNKIENGLPSSG